MKKLLVIFIAIFCISFCVSAQPRAIGLKLGGVNSISYQHTLGGENFLELNLGSYTLNSLDISAAYDFMIAQPKWTDKGIWGFYVGPGLSLGSGFNGNYIFGLGAFAQVGLEYTFWFPLQLAADLHPGFNFVARDDISQVYFNILCIVPSISVRYRF